MPDASRDTLRAGRLRIALRPMRVRVFARLRSTQQKAIEELESGRLAPPALIAAARQTAGRGRRANRWWSDAGSLCATFLLPAAGTEGVSPLFLTSESQGSKGVSPLFLTSPLIKNKGLTPFPPFPAGQVPLRAGLAVAEVVARRLPRAKVQVKWPNDVLVEGRKIAGVLCERRGGCDIIGIGLNVRVALHRLPPDVRRRATSLHRHHRRPPPREQLLVDIAAALVHALTRTDFEAAFAQRCALTGRPLRVRTASGPQSGPCRGVDEEGRLLVETQTGLLRITDSAQLD